jgi:hypothetical protein
MRMGAGSWGRRPPQRTTLLELIQAFVSYARSHELPDNAALAVTRALQEAFPCKAREGFRGLWGAATAKGSIHARFGSPLETWQNVCSRCEAVGVIHFIWKEKLTTAVRTESW